MIYKDLQYVLHIELFCVINCGESLDTHCFKLKYFGHIDTDSEYRPPQPPWWVHKKLLCFRLIM